METIFCIGIGLLSGFMAGMLGIGGGVVIVPALVYTLPQMGVSGPDIARIAIGTSLAIIIPTAVSSARAHASRKAVNWAAFVRLAPGVIAGSLAGAGLLSIISTKVAVAIFSAFAFYAAWDMARLRTVKTAQPEHFLPLPSFPIFAAKGFGIGVLSALVGIGGGLLSVPVLSAHVPMRTAVGTGAALGLPLATSAVVGYVLMAPPEGCAACVGYVFPQAVLFTGIAALLAAPFGARAAHAMPVMALRRLFAVFLVFIGMDLAYGSFLNSSLAEVVYRAWAGI